MSAKPRRAAGPGTRTGKKSPKPPDRARLRTIRDRLRAYYGRPRNIPHRTPLDELVLTILSQNTNDHNRDVAYARLRARFPSWKEVAAAPPADIEAAIRPGGISRVKSKRIAAVLRTIDRKRSDLELDWLEHAPRDQALAFLKSLPGVGRKTAACVLLFSYNRPELPVDTHVYRVVSRLGLIRPKTSPEAAHDVLLALVDPNDTYELHVNMIRHGRRLCLARGPRCERCPLRRLCPYGRDLAAKRRKGG